MKAPGVTVEFWGGPRDGEIIIVPKAGRSEILLPVLPDLPAMMVDDDGADIPDTTIEVLSVPVTTLARRDANGITTKWVAYWPGRSRR